MSELSQKLRDEHYRRTGWPLSDEREHTIRIALELLIEEAEKKKFDDCSLDGSEMDGLVYFDDLKAIVAEIVK